MIELKDIVVKFGDFEALHNIKRDVKEGEFFTFLGPSGCGKNDHPAHHHRLHRAGGGHCGSQGTGHHPRPH